VHVLLGQCVDRSLDPLLLVLCHKVVRIFGLLAAVRARDSQLIGERPPLVGFHLERLLAGRALAAEETVVVDRQRKARLKPFIGRFDV
jgi:hypothetical protein